MGTPHDCRGGSAGLRGEDGQGAGRPVHRLYNECAWLHLKWGDYVGWSGTSQSRVDVLNASARGFFVQLDASLWRDLLLHLCVLTDDPEVGRRQTSTVRRLPQAGGRCHPRQGEGARLRSGQENQVREDGATAISPIGIRTWRSATARSRSRLPSRKRVKEAITAIVAGLAAVEGHYRKIGNGLRARLAPRRCGGTALRPHGWDRGSRCAVPAAEGWDHRPEDFAPRRPI